MVEFDGNFFVGGCGEFFEVKLYCVIGGDGDFVWGGIGGVEGWGGDGVDGD